MLRINHRVGDDGGGNGFNTMSPKPLEGDLLLAPLFVGLPTLQGGVLFGTLFSLEQKEVPPSPQAPAISGAALLSGAIPSLQALAREAASLILCGVINSAAALALPQGLR